MRKYEEAILSYDKAICLGNNCFEAYSNKGVCLSNLGKYKEAILSYDKAISLKSDFYKIKEIRYTHLEITKMP